MAENLPVNFPIPGESSIASYDWVDVANGTGYIRYYLNVACTGTGTQGYTLSESGIYSNVVAWQSAALTTNANTEVFNNIFVTTLNSPKTINGNALVNIAAKLGGLEASRMYHGVEIIKISGGAETILGHASGALIIGTAATPPVMDHENVSLISIPITKTHLKKGDQVGIRLHTYAWKTAASTPSLMYIGLDPMNRTSSLTGPNILTTTNSIVNLPVELDL